MRIVIVALALSAMPADAKTTRVDGYVRKDGTYVAPHVRTTPNDTRTDNWSSAPNVNPTTGQSGAVDPYKPTSNDPWGTGKNKKRKNP